MTNLGPVPFLSHGGPLGALVKKQHNEKASISRTVGSRSVQQAEFPQGQPDEKEAENIENHSIHGDEQAEFPQGQPDIEKQDDSHNSSDDNGHLGLELQLNNSGHDHDDYKEMENKNDFPETPITNLDPENELLNAKCNITSKKETEDRERKSARLAAKSKATKNKKKEDRKENEQD